jgi:FKBP-type peptidyl-prolyl cis-trans isomerase 2
MEVSLISKHRSLLQTSVGVFGFFLCVAVGLAGVQQPGSISQKSTNAREKNSVSNKSEKGDLTKVYWTGYTDNGKIFYTNSSEIDSDAGKAKVEWYARPKDLIPQEIVAGDHSEPFNLGSIIEGLGLNDTRKAMVEAEKAFGKRDPAKVISLPCERSMPKIFRMQPSQFIQATNRFPVVGKEVTLNPYFNARVLEVTENETTIEFLARNEKVKEKFGTTEIQLRGDDISLKLVPTVGSNFEAQNQQGIIIATDGLTFQVDYNHPLAGKDVMVELQVVDITKASGLKEGISWMDDHDQGLSAAVDQGKPMFLLLYADWCSWSKKVINESLQDPRIRAIKDKFVWVKVDSDKEQAVKEAYQQNGFPMVVVLNAKGDVVKKIDGYRDAAALKRELEEVL